LGKRLERVEIIPISHFGVVSCFLVKGSRPVLVDTGLPHMGPGILRRIAREEYSPSDLALILITHCHSDHAGNVAYLQRATGAPVAVHPLESGALRAGRPDAPEPFTTAGRLLSAAAPFVRGVNVEPVEPAFLVDDGFGLDRFGVDGRVIATPGHTAGSISVLLDNGDAIVGDLVMGGILRPQAPGMPRWATAPALLRSSIEKILSLEPARLYASHGGPFKPQDVRRLLDSLSR